MDWLAVLRAIPEDRRVVVHVPETPRYQRARGKLRYVVESAKFARRPTGSGAGRRLSRGDLDAARAWPRFRLHACFRIFFEGDAPVFAALYCFYDGTERSLSLESASAALTYARSHHFLQELP